MLTKPELSIVLPAYNEEDNIVRAISKVDEAISSLGFTYEIIVVNDGSNDGTVKRALEYAQNNNHVRVIGYPRNMGKGYAIKTGFMKAKGHAVIFLDSDLDIKPVRVKQYIQALDYGDIVIASKRHPNSRVEVPPLRRFLSRGFNLLVRLLTRLDVSDTQSGLKAMRKDSLEKVFSSLLVKRYAFDVELLAVANLYGLKIIEMPVSLKITNSLFNPKEIFKMFIDLLAITYRIRIKRYYQNHISNLIKNE